MFSRPLDGDGYRLDVSEFTTHKVTHDFKLPCCFCGLLKGIPSKYFEASVYSNPEYQIHKDVGSQWLIVCSDLLCGFKGTLLFSSSINSVKLINPTLVNMRHATESGNHPTSSRIGRVDTCLQTDKPKGKFDNFKSLKFDWHSYLHSELETPSGRSPEWSRMLSRASHASWWFRNSRRAIRPPYQRVFKMRLRAYRQSLQKTQLHDPEHSYTRTGVNTRT